VVVYGNGIASNPFGHVGIAFTGQGVYSFGTGTPLGGSLIDYLEKQALYRDSTLYTLKTTPGQEAQMLAEILKYRDTPLPNPLKNPKNAWNDTCATRTQNSLDAGGINSILVPFTSPFPADTGFIAARNGAIQTTISKGEAVPSSLNSFNK
jgi:hypothetical protein